MEEDYTFQNPNPHLHSRSHLLVKLWKEIFKFTSSFFFFFSFINQALDSCNITSFKRSMTTSQVFPACCFTCSLGRNYLVLVRVLWIESRESKDRFSTERNRFNVQIPPPGKYLFGILLEYLFCKLNVTSGMICTIFSNKPDKVSFYIFEFTQETRNFYLAPLLTHLCHHFR